MDTFLFVASSATQGTSTPRVLKAQYGDGYMQEAGDGINPILRVWNLQFNNIPISSTDSSATTLEAIDDFLTAQAGYLQFLWTQPPPYDEEGTKHFICSSWQYTYQGGNIIGLIATFEQRPEV